MVIGFISFKDYYRIVSLIIDIEHTSIYFKNGQLSYQPQLRSATVPYAAYASSSPYPRAKARWLPTFFQVEYDSLYHYYIYICF